MTGNIGYSARGRWLQSRAEMLYVLIEAQRAWLGKAQKDSDLMKHGRAVSEDKGGTEDKWPGLGVLGFPLTKAVTSLCQPRIKDSEWLRLNPQEKFAWAEVSRDPRVAAGQQSPLEKRILNLGGVHTTAARHLVTQTYQEEGRTLCREQARSLDYWLAKAESYYNKRRVEMMKKEDRGDEGQTKPEGETAWSAEGQRQRCWVPERERRQIERHILQTGQAREFKNRTWKHPRLLSETMLPKIVPKIVPEKQGAEKTQRTKQVKGQIKDHQERMIRGRELLEQRLKGKSPEGEPEPAPPKRERVKKGLKEFERVVAYPLFQPCRESRIKVNILMEKSSDGEGVGTVVKPYRRRFLAVPPFLRTQIGKIKDQ